MSSNWFYLRGDQRFGPVTTLQLKQLAIAGQLDPSDMLWKEGMPDWVLAKTAKGLFPDAAERQSAADNNEPILTTDEPPSAPGRSASDGIKIVAAAGANFVRSAVQRGKASLKQTFGEATKQTILQSLAAAGQVIRHPIRLSFVTIIFLVASGLALGSLVGSVLFPVFVMGYITCIRSTLSGEQVALETFITFMRHGWDSFWHLLMLLAAFFITMSAMLAPFIIIILVLAFVLDTVGAAISQMGLMFKGKPNYEQVDHVSSDQDNSDLQLPSHYSERPSEFSRWVFDVVRQIAALGMMVILLIFGVIVLTPVAAALILFFYLVFEVSRGGVEGNARFELVYAAFIKMLAIGRSNWRELVTSGLSVSIVLVGIGAIGFLLAYLLSDFHLHVLAGWVLTGLMPAAICFFIVYVNVFVTMTCLSLEKRAS